MTVNYALLDAEVKQGYILTCQSHPTTDTLIVDYDKGR
jgi:ring-1,2-phenylacetyl-CoA epoxidase subunit PaaE